MLLSVLHTYSLSFHSKNSFSIFFQLKKLLDRALHKRTKSFAKKPQHGDGLSTVHEAYQYLMKTYPGVQPALPTNFKESTLLGGTVASKAKSSSNSSDSRRRISQTSMGTLSNSSSRRSSDTSSVISFNEVVEVIEPEFKRPSTAGNIPTIPAIYRPCPSKSAKTRYIPEIQYQRLLIQALCVLQTYFRKYFPISKK